MGTPLIFADTNVLIESFRLGIWMTLSRALRIATVEKCVEEANAGDTLRHGYVSVDQKALRAGLAWCEPATKAELSGLGVAYPEFGALDDGERHLIAVIQARFRNSKIISTADKAAVRALHQLDWLDDTQSLETLARSAHVADGKILMLDEQFRESWLGHLRMEIRLGVL